MVLFDVEHIKLTAAIFLTKDKVIEVRTSKTPKLGIQAGWFNNTNDLIKSVQILSGRIIVYLTHNPVNSALLARVNNRIKDHIEHTSGDKDITKREWIFSDFDPDRPAGISSTDEEHDKAIKRVYEVYEYLQISGFPKESLIVADSGNGGHVLIRVDLPNDDKALILVKKIFKVLKAKFESDGILVDQSVVNASRIGKFYGTLAVKGDNIPERPHRIARLLEYSEPSNIKAVSPEILTNFASLLPDDPAPSRTPARGDRFDVIKFMSAYNLEVKREKPIDDGMLYELKVCPFNPEHNQGEASIIQFNSGALSFKCHHDSCNAYKWADLRAKCGAMNDANNTYLYINNIDRTNLSTHESDKNRTENRTSEAESESKTGQVNSSPLSGRIFDWVKGTSGWWATDELDRDLGIISTQDKDNRIKIIQRLRNQGTVERHEKLNKQFRYVNTKVTTLNFKTASNAGVLQIKWALGIENLVNTFPGNMAVIAGAPNAGKTGYLLDFIYLNQDKFPIYYFCSEMGEIELRDRLSKFPGMDIDDWHFQALERSSDFSDVVVPDCVNIVDFLEITTDLWEVNKHLTAINHKLGTGVAIVALQKKEGAKYGRGQEFGLEKPKLYLSLDKGKMVIVKGKSWTMKNVDPQGLSIKFTINNGCLFNPLTGWYREDGSEVFKPANDLIIPKTQKLIPEDIFAGSQLPDCTGCGKCDWWFSDDGTHLICELCGHFQAVH